MKINKYNFKTFIPDLNKYFYIYIFKQKYMNTYNFVLVIIASISIPVFSAKPGFHDLADFRPMCYNYHCLWLDIEKYSFPDH